MRLGLQRAEPCHTTEMVMLGVYKIRKRQTQHKDPKQYHSVPKGLRSRCGDDGGGDGGGGRDAQV